MSEVLVLFVSLVASALGALLVHEIGHLAAARCSSVRASELGLGMGPRVFGFSLAGLRVSFCALPIGSYLMLDGAALAERSAARQVLIHLGGIVLNLIVCLAAYGTLFGWMNLLLAVGNLLPLYQHDGWKCGLVIVRAVLRKKSQPVERVFTFSGGFLSLVIGCAIIRTFV